MKKTSRLILGCLDDASISSLNRRDASFISSFEYVLITSLDSIRDLKVAGFARFAHDENETGLLGSGIVLKGQELSRLDLETELFTGFDEVWCFLEYPTIPKPADLVIVGPTELGVDPPPQLLAGWLQRSGCVIGLGDGTGLNYATRDPQLKTRLLKVLA